MQQQQHEDDATRFVAELGKTVTNMNKPSIVYRPGEDASAEERLKFQAKIQQLPQDRMKFA